MKRTVFEHRALHGVLTPFILAFLVMEMGCGGNPPLERIPGPGHEVDLVSGGHQLKAEVAMDHLVKSWLEPTTEHEPRSLHAQTLSNNKDTRLQ